MDDKELDELLMVARKSYRVPPEPAVEAIWQTVEREAFAERPARRGFDWRLTGVIAAASLLIGVTVGRWTVRGAGTTATVAATASGPPAARVATAYGPATEEVLGRTAVLLAALRSNDTHGVDATQMREQAQRLLLRVRLLLDSPAAADPYMQSLLLDLELTLAHVARMQPTRGETDLTLINETVAERNIVPRIRAAVVDLSADGY